MYCFGKNDQKWQFLPVTHGAFMYRWKNLTLPHNIYQISVNYQQCVCHIFVLPLSRLLYLPNQACWSPCTSMARPKSASFTAAFLHLLARSRFSGWSEERKRAEDCQTSWIRKQKLRFYTQIQADSIYPVCMDTLKVWQSTVQQGDKSRFFFLSLMWWLYRLCLCGPDNAVGLIILCQRRALIMGCYPQLQSVHNQKEASSCQIFHPYLKTKF